MVNAGRNAIDFQNLVVFLVFKIREPLYDNVYGPPVAPSLRVAAREVLKPACSLDTKEIREIMLVIESVVGGVGQDLLLLGCFGRGLLRDGERVQGQRAKYEIRKARCAAITGHRA